MMCKTSLCRLLFGMGLLLIIGGCLGGDKLPLGKVEGKVLFRGKPLEFGSVIFQPPKGPLAKGKIQPDGTFVLSTYADGDGAVFGSHAVQVRCFTSQSPNAPPPDPNTESTPGQSLIPKKYTRFDTSGLTAEVKENNEPIVFNLQ